MSSRRWLIAALAALSLLARPAGADTHAERADALYRRALVHIGQNTMESRRLAMVELEDATRFAPNEPEYEITLARLYFQVGFLKEARQRFEHVVALAPDDFDARLGLGRVWRRDWLKFLDHQSLRRACASFAAAADLRPQSTEAWLALVPLLVESDSLGAAERAAEHACSADSARPEAVLALAYTSYRLGDLPRADQLFARVVPRLPRAQKRLFDDIAPVASARDTFALHRLSPPDQEEFIRRFWKDQDPDLASPENEAQLEYWSRVTHAMFLYYDSRLGGWDERGEVYVRFGPPEGVLYNPPGVPLNEKFATGPEYPKNVLLWLYPRLGLQVQLEDRLLTERYLLPIRMEYDPDPQIAPEVAANLDDRFATGSGRGVFSKLPPNVEPRPLEGAIARFQSDRGGRLIAHLATPGSAVDSLTAEWVVLDSSRTEVARAQRRFAPSACDPVDDAVADFAADLAPGAYSVGLAVTDAQGRRGTSRMPVVIDRPASSLALSDLVITCGVPLPGDESAPVRLEPNPARRVDGDALTAYFEIYHLQQDGRGEARFEYQYRVRAVSSDHRVWIQRVLNPRPLPSPIEATREEINAGSLRRQFVSVPMSQLPAGRYRLEVRVRDLASGDEATRTVEFTHDALAAARPRGGG